MTKNELRQLYKQKRKQLSGAQIASQSEAIAHLFFDYFDLDKTKIVHSYLPITQQNEPNTWLIIKHIVIQYPHIKIVLPRSLSATNDIENYIWQPNIELQTNKWGILEPNPATTIKYKLSDYDMVILPLLAYDINGNRVGYGKGYYDKFLANCSSKTLKIGLSFFEPVEKIIDTEEHDISLDYCITPRKVWQF